MIARRPLLNQRQSAPIRIKLLSPPYSLDPIDYDADVHHITTRPVLGSLVTQYKAGTFEGVVSDSWSNSADLSTWRFHIRQGLMFSNGDAITPNIVAQSLTRIAWLQHSRSSKSGLTEQLVGINQLTSARGKFSGIVADGDSVVLSFIQPQPKLLETISFGLYGITHPSDYEGTSGRWRDSHKITASGAYLVAEWSPDHMRLALREDFPRELRHEHAAQEIEMVWGDHLTGPFDLAMGNSLAPEGHDHDEFLGSGAVNIYLYYIHLLSWNLPSSPLRDRNLRLALRTHFYKRLQELGVNVVRSFLPTSLPGISAFNDPIIGDCGRPSRFSLLMAPPRSRAKIFMNMLAAVKLATDDCGGETKEAPALGIKEITALMDPNMGAYSADLTQRYTGILVEDPVSDVKFMVQSKEGIRLPDPTGRLAAEAANPQPDLREINRILWDDAIVWPVTPFTYGLWATKGMFDFSQIDLGLPPSDLTWIGLRN